MRFLGTSASKSSANSTWQVGAGGNLRIIGLPWEISASEPAAGEVPGASVAAGRCPFWRQRRPVQAATTMLLAGGLVLIVANREQAGAFQPRRQLTNRDLEVFLD